MALHLTGIVTGFEQRSGTSAQGPYAYTQMTVRDDESQTFWKMRVEDNFGTLPTVGEECVLLVTARAYKAGSGLPQIALNAVRQVVPTGK